MPAANYSTIVQESAIMALGPFRQQNTSCTYGVAWGSNRSVLIKGSATPAYYYVPSTELQVPSHLLHPAVEVELLDSSYTDMLLSEAVLSQDWDSPEDDEAWADL